MTVKHLSSDWVPVVQQANSLDVSLSEPFEQGKAFMTFQRPEELEGANFVELTNLLFREKGVERHGWAPLSETDISLCRARLSDSGKKAANIVLSDLKALSRFVGGEDRLIAKIEGPDLDRGQYEQPHADGCDVVIVRYSGPKLRIYHPRDIENIPFREFNAVVKSGAKPHDTEPGHIWLVRAKNFLSFSLTSSFPFVERDISGGVHAKGTANGQPGLVTICDLVHR